MDAGIALALQVAGSSAAFARRDFCWNPEPLDSFKHPARPASRTA